MPFSHENLIASKNIFSEDLEKLHEDKFTLRQGKNRVCLSAITFLCFTLQT